MVNKSEEIKEERVEKKDMPKIWTDNYTAFSKIWEDSYLNLYKSWIESIGYMFEKTTSPSKESAPQRYREFYDEWIKIYQKSFGKFYPIPTSKFNKDILEKFLTSAEESNKLYKSWISELEENSRRTKEILQDDSDSSKFKECYDMWIKSYEKIFDEFLELSAKDSTKEIFGNYMGIPDIYSGIFLQMSKIWKKSYVQLCIPLNDSMLKLSEKMAYISRGDADPEAYKEFYTLLEEIYEQHIQSMKPSKEMFERFIQNTNTYVNMYKSWIVAIEKMSERVKELPKQSSDPKKYKEFYNLWIKIYEKAFDNFFEDMPTIGGPMKEAMEPVKIMAKIYADIFAKMSKLWVGQIVDSTSVYPEKNKK